MANRFPLVVDSSTSQIKELPSGDNVDLTGSSLVGASNVSASIIITDNLLFSNGTAWPLATQAYVGTQITNLVNSAPSTLDTLNELATALGNDANFSTTVATNIGVAHTKANAAYTQANTATTDAATADSKAVTAGQYANSSYTQANTATTNALAASTYANSAYTQANTATTNAATADSKAVTAGSYANSAYAQANTDYTTISATAGVYGGSADIPVITLAANGRVSSITNTAISIPAGTSVYGNTGQITANAATGTVALGLATTAVTAGVYGGTANTVTITVDAYGRITALANNAIAGGGGGGGSVSITNDTSTNLNTYYPMLSTVTTGTLSTANTSSTKLYFNPSTGTLNSTIFNSLSDKNFKTDLVQISDALEKLKQLTGYTYTLIDSGERSAGLLSQDVNNVLPESVREKDGIQSLNYNATIGLIVESIKILSDKIDSINDRLG